MKPRMLKAEQRDNKKQGVGFITEPLDQALTVAKPTSGFFSYVRVKYVLCHVRQV